MAVANLSYTTIAFATELLENYGHEFQEVWTNNLTQNQQQQMLNFAALQLEMGYCLDKCIKELNPIPLLLQQANVWQMLDWNTNSLNQLLNGATSIRIDVLQVQRSRTYLNEPVNPFGEFVDKFMNELGYQFCGRGNMRMIPIDIRG